MMCINNALCIGIKKRVAVTLKFSIILVTAMRIGKPGMALHVLM